MKRLIGLPRKSAMRQVLIISLTVLTASPALAQRANLAPVLGGTGALSNGARTSNVEVSIPTVVQQKQPADAKRRWAIVRHVEIEGSFPQFQNQTSALIAGVQGRRLSLAEAYQFTANVQQIYLDAGYPLVNAVLEPAAFAAGEIRIKIVDGFIESLDLSGVPQEIRELVRARLSPVVGHGHLTKAELERHIQLLGELPGVNGGTKSKLGDIPGGIVLEVTATQTPFSESTSVNNYLPEQNGTYLFTQAFGLNNALGFGENLHAEFSSSDDFGHVFDGTAKSEAFGVGGVLPIGPDGFTLGAGYAQSRTSPSPTPIQLDTGDYASENSYDEFQRLSLRAGYPLLLTGKQSLHGQIGFDFVDNASTLSPYPYLNPAGQPDFNLFHDQYEDVRIGAEWHVAFPWAWGGNAITGAIYTHGLGGLSGSVTDPLSRPGASPDFNKFYGEVRIQQPLPESFVLSLLGRGQTSFGQSLMESEELQLAGPDALSGFGLGTIYADSGAVGRAELQRPIAVSLKGGAAVVTPYLFGAAGGGRFEDVYPGEDPNVSATSFGVGLRGAAKFTAWPFYETLNLELARVDSNVPFTREGYSATFNYSMSYSGDPLGAPQLGLERSPDLRSIDFASGFYAGVNSGYAFDASPDIASTGKVVSRELDENSPPSNGADVSAANITGSTPASAATAIGGGQVGYNFVNDRWLFGGEADIQGAGQGTISQSVRTATATAVGDPQPVTTVLDDSKSLDWLGTVRGRIGMLATPSLLAYATGGLAYGGVSANTRAAQSWPANAYETPYSLASSSVANGGFSDTLVGWTAGAGLEWMFAPGFSVKGEYLYYDLGEAHFPSGVLVTAPLGGVAGENVVASNSSTRFNGHIIRVGLNYYFGVQDEHPSLVVKGPPEETRPVWNGYYAGLNAGYNFGFGGASASNSAKIGSTDLDETIPLDLAPLLTSLIGGNSKAAPNGFLGGAQIGYNITHDRGLVGLEADIQGTGAKGHGAYTNYYSSDPNNLFALQTRVDNVTGVDWLGTLRGRLGLFLRSDLLAYTTGGLAYGETSSGTFIDQKWSGTFFPFQTTGSIGLNNRFMAGWTAGAGLEWMFSRNLSLKGEYLYYDLGVARYGASPSSLAFILSDTALPSTAVRYNGQILRLGLNYHFD